MGKPYINAIKTKEGEDRLIVEGKYAPNFEAADDKKDAFAKTIRPAYDAAKLVKDVEKTYVSVSINYGADGYKSYFVNLANNKEDGKPLVVLKEQGNKDAEPIFINVNESKKVVGDKVYPDVMLKLSDASAQKLNLDKIEVNTFKTKDGVEQQSFKTTAFYNVSDSVKQSMLEDLKAAGEGGRLELKERGGYTPTSLDEIWAKKATPSKEQEAPKVDKKDKEQAIDM